MKQTTSVFPIYRRPSWEWVGYFHWHFGHVRLLLSNNKSFAAYKFGIVCCMRHKICHANGTYLICEVKTDKNYK